MRAQGEAMKTREELEAEAVISVHRPIIGGKYPGWRACLESDDDSWAYTPICKTADEAWELGRIAHTRYVDQREAEEDDNDRMEREAAYRDNVRDGQ
jgi:hypothetical protein